MSGPIVVKLGGTTIEANGSGADLWRSLGALHARRPGGVALVHGGGRDVDEHLARLGHSTRREEGLRVTPPEQVAEIAGVLAGRLNKSVVGYLARAGVESVGLCLGDGGMAGIPTRLVERHAVLGRVGEVVAPQPGRGSWSRAGSLVRDLLAGGFVPVISSIGIDARGEFLNVNADDAASGVAAYVGASALLLVTDVAGVMGADGEVVAELNRAGVEGLIEEGVISGGMIPKVRAAMATATRIAAPVVILSAATLETYSSGRTVGTRIIGEVEESGKQRE